MDKIALEEHFGMPGLSQYLAIGQYGFTKEAVQDLNHRLQVFDDLRLQEMEEGNITKTILSQAAPGIESAPNARQAVTDAKRVNDFLARQIERHPDRFGGFATVPMHAPEEAADELERAVRQLGFYGALINGHTYGQYLDEDRCKVFWERVADLKVPIYLHPTLAFQVPQNHQDHPELQGALWGWTPETATHLLNRLCCINLRKAEFSCIS